MLAAHPNQLRQARHPPCGAARATHMLAEPLHAVSQGAGAQLRAGVALILAKGQHRHNVCPRGQGKLDKTLAPPQHQVHAAGLHARQCTEKGGQAHGILGWQPATERLPAGTQRGSAPAGTPNNQRQADIDVQQAQWQQPAGRQAHQPGLAATPRRRPPPGRRRSRALPPGAPAGCCGRRRTGRAAGRSLGRTEHTGGGSARLHACGRQIGSSRGGHRKGELGNQRGASATGLRQGGSRASTCFCVQQAALHCAAPSYHPSTQPPPQPPT